MVAAKHHYEWGPAPRADLTKRIIQNKMPTNWWDFLENERMWEYGSQNWNSKAEFGHVQKVNTVAKSENIGSYEALESVQEIEKGKEEVERE